MNEMRCLNCETCREPEIEKRTETYKVRGESISVEAEVAVCPQCRADIDCEELDEATLRAAFNEYRRRHDLMLPAEMQALRRRYGLGVRAFSLLLGWGELTLHRYETGSLQDAAHEMQLRMAENPDNVRVMLAKSGHRLTSRQRATVEARLADETVCECGGETQERFLVRENQDEYGGWKAQELSKLRELMVGFSSMAHVYPTKLNKLLFYADFLHFKRHSVSITGTPYLAFQHGPVPEHYDRILADLYEGGELTKEEVDFPDGTGGELLHAGREADVSIFSADEVETIEAVRSALGSLSSRALRERSHGEKAWAETAQTDLISYERASELSLS